MIVETEFYPGGSERPIIFVSTAPIYSPPVEAVFRAIAAARKLFYHPASRLIFTAEEVQFVLGHDQTQQAIRYACTIQKKSATPAAILSEIFGIEVIPERRRPHEPFKKTEVPCL